MGAQFQVASFRRVSLRRELFVSRSGLFCQGFARVFIRARWLCNREMLFFSLGHHTLSRVVLFSVRGQRAFSRGGSRSFRTRVRLLGWSRFRFVPAGFFFRLGI